MVFTHPKSEEDHTPASSKFTPALSLQFRFGARMLKEIRLTADTYSYEYADMRTIIDIPDDLGRIAKVRAVQSGESIKCLVTRALQRETAADRSVHQSSKPSDIPVLRSRNPGALTLTPEEVGDWLVREERAVYGADVRR